MLRFYKLISTLLHPVVIPTIGSLLFLHLTPQIIIKERQYLLLAIVFFATYIVPIIILFILKTLGVISSFKVSTIKERKIPLFVMMIVFYILGNLFYNIPEFKEFGMLFYGTNIAMAIIYLLFSFQLKVSLHLMSISSAIGFFLIFGYVNSITTLPIVAILFLLSGLLGSSRLYLKAHSKQEVYLGFFLGFFCQFVIFYIL